MNRGDERIPKPANLPSRSDARISMFYRERDAFLAETVETQEDGEIPDDRGWGDLSALCRQVPKLEKLSEWLNSKVKMLLMLY